VKHTVIAKIPNSDNITLELDDSLAPRTVSLFLKHLPFELDANVWGKEIYTSSAPFSTSLENAKDVVDLFDVAFWPPGKAICLFYGPTPIGTNGEIKPYSPVTVIGRIIKPDIKVISKASNQTLSFRLS
jgi:hypothetical protein